MYDIYLTMRCRERPELEDLAREAPALSDPAFHEHIQTKTLQGPGFLHLDLPAPLAYEVLKRLKARRAVGNVLDAAYREPKITREQAMHIAERAIADQQRQRFPHYDFEPVQFRASQPATWRFASGCKQLQAEGLIPGALFADVDKLDGHIWQEQDFERFHRGN